jgi:hypothetical protein
MKMEALYAETTVYYLLTTGMANCDVNLFIYFDLERIRKVRKTLTKGTSVRPLLSATNYIRDPPPSTSRCAQVSGYESP